MRGRALRLGSLPPLRVSPGTLIMVLVLAVLMYPALERVSETPSRAILLAIGVGGFLVLSVLVHEAAHALIARAFGARVDHIALTLWGGHTQYRGGPRGGLGSILISLAGPVSNLLLAALTFAITALATDPGTPAALFWGFCSWLNLALALFNLLPGLPMDGGRALEALLGSILRRPTVGTRVTAWIGRGLAIAVVLVPLWRAARGHASMTGQLLTIVWAVLIASLLWSGASRALEGARVQERAERLDAGDLLRSMLICAPQTPLGQLPAQVDPEQVLVVDLAPDPAAPGSLGRAYRLDTGALAAVPAPRREATAVSAIAMPIGPVRSLPGDLAGDALLSAMLDAPAPVYLVREADGSVRGVIMSADVNARLRGR